ncbi:GNAT family N-acetyltransferase [Hoyosella altamirensis]|uniref:Ribosomal protein S18 acetylase RimI-like enzyme n=1 Tax=Hoyosella altamirensis TaxID=616997 RepID=A0A839RIJ5_9ACTN|nr:GNAT family N-acetyltransferase [Hoyosella altamirensis]MBB3036207.1 ribosomal protein S18 acetylase RimI-like enzyme [Hoyosella altamirensis]
MTASPPHLVIRPIEARDFAAVSLITVESYRPFIRPDDDYFALLADTERRASASEIVVAEVSGQVVGSLTMVEWGSPYADVAQQDELEFRMIAVNPRARGHGVGTALVEYGIRVARARGRSRVVLSTMDVMVEARRIYDRLGFAEAPDRRWHPAISVLTFPLHRGATGQRSQQNSADDPRKVTESRDF